MYIFYKLKQKNCEMTASNAWARAQSVGQRPRLWRENKVGGLARNVYNSGAVSRRGWEGKKKRDGCVDLAKSWRRKRRDMKIIGVSWTLDELEKIFKGAKGNLKEHFGSDYSDFEVIGAEGKEHVAVVD